jgi:hypothetical protein
LVEMEVKEELPPHPPQQQGGWAPALAARVSHNAGFPTAFCDGGINGVIFFLLCGTLLSPVIMLLWTCCAVETAVALSRSGGSVAGTVTRRSVCCTWTTRVEGVTEVKTTGSDGEGPDPVFLHYCSGAAKLEISEGFVAGLEGPINTWIKRQGSV